MAAFSNFTNLVAEGGGDEEGSQFRDILRFSKKKKREKVKENNQT